MNHGGPSSSVRHVGDIGNLVTASSSSPTPVDKFDFRASLYPGVNSVVNRAFVLHAGRDDFGANGDPSGTAVSYFNRLGYVLYIANKRVL